MAFDRHISGDPSLPVLVLETPGGLSRRRCLTEYSEEEARAGARTFHLSCHFDSGGPWAGVNGLFAELFPELRAQRPDLVERHSLELVYVLPQLRHMLTVNNPTLTDLSANEERVRSYPADRAFRTVHGLIDLLDHWKQTSCPDTPWVIACDDYDGAGAMGTRFFTELMRRRGESLRLRLLVAAGPGKGEQVCGLFSRGRTKAKLVPLDLPAEPEPAPDQREAAEKARDLEKKVAGDRLDMQINIPDLIRLWHQAGRPDKVLQYKWFGLDQYNTLGLYADALHYADGILELVMQHAPDDEYQQWSIMVKMLNAYIGLQDVPATFQLAEGEALNVAQRDPAKLGYLYYMLAMLHARYKKPRDLAKGEEYLDWGLAALEQADMPEEDFHFHSVFNRNGLAMVRNFQGRHQDAIELCRSGLARLNAHLSADRHRLHRSVLVYNIGQVYLATGNHDEALKHYAAAISMDPNYSEYYNERGGIFLQLGRLEEARADYLKAIELSPPYFEVFTNLGQCYRRTGAMKEAIEAYSRALDLEPNQVLALVGRAKAHEELGQTEAAIEDYTAALALDAALWEARASRGVMYYQAGDLQASLGDFDRAIELRPNQCELYENRATVLADLGRDLEAVRDLEKALGLAPSGEDKRAIEARLQALQRADVGEKASAT